MNENTIDGVFFLSLATLMCTSVTLLIRYCYKSKCTEFECLCFKLKRNVDIEKEEDFMFNNNNNSPKN
jgi:hypothetical protein